MVVVVAVLLGQAAAAALSLLSRTLGSPTGGALGGGRDGGDTGGGLVENKCFRKEVVCEGGGVKKK
jgi:hypothetical protein